MKNRLPKRWTNVNLGELFNIKSTIRVHKSDWKKKGIPFYRAREIVKLAKDGFVENELFISEELYLDYKRRKGVPKENDLIVSAVGTLGKCYVVGRDEVFYLKDASVLWFEKITDCDSNFIEYFFLSPQLLNQMNSFAYGTTVNTLTIGNANKLSIPLPPLPEQQKIVSILDATLGRIAQAIALIEENIEKVQQLNASVLDKVLKNSDWKEVVLKDLTTKIGSGSTPRGGRSSYKDVGISLIRSMNVHDNDFRVKGLAFIDEQQAAKLSNVTIEQNDVLLNITGASVARCCVVPKEVLPARVNQHVSILRCDKKQLLPEFLHLCLISPYYKNKLLVVSGGGATREAITKVSQENFKIRIPSVVQQQVIVNYLSDIRSKNSKLIQHYQNKLKALQALKNSVLDSAFKGKLRKTKIAVKQPNHAFLQMQLIGLSIYANKKDNIAQGEMAIAKDMYLLDRLYGVDTKMKFVNHSWGPFAPEMKKRINNKQYFNRKNFPNSNATYVDVQNEETLLGKVSEDLAIQINDGIKDLNDKLFLKVTKYKRAETKELLATVLKCIEDTQSVELSNIREAMSSWKIKQGQFKTKAEKFSQSACQKMLQFIIKNGWDLKVIR